MELKEKEEVKEYLKNLGIEYRYSCFSEKSPTGCQLLGEYLAQIRNEFDKANKVWKENCDEREHGRSCSSYAMHSFMGRGCTRDFMESIKYFTKGCDNGDALGCDFTGKMLSGIEPKLKGLIEFDGPKGLHYLEKGCNLGNPTNSFESGESCYAAAFAKTVALNGIQTDFDGAKKYASMACEFEHVNACKFASRLYEKDGDLDNAKKYEEMHKKLQKQTEGSFSLEMQRT